ncbi:SPFH domain-containing protein [bacterium 210820-DFI.6.37]|nr:SPFH domain-containing protein [bacterium 210820-DFI.6.37]
MYQSIIRDPGGTGLIRIQPDVCGQYSAIVNGSILIVPPGTTAFVAINGTLSHPYGPGRYEIFTGVDPFFVRLRNILTRGDSGTTVSVFFVSTERAKFVKLGTGEFPFREHRFRITMKALASCNLSFSVSNPLKILTKLVGSYSSVFSEEDIDPCIEQMVITPIREAISKEISKLDITEFNSKLSHIGNMAAATIRNGLSEYGIKMERFNLVAINIPDSEINRLYSLEQEYAGGKTRTDLELDNLQRVWNGNVNNRTLSEMMTGIPSRGQAPSSGATNPGGNAGGMAPMMMQMMMLSQMLPALREPLADMTRHTDMFSGSTSDAQESTSSADAPPPIPGRYKRCPSCNGNVMRGNSVCPICGYRF